MHTWNFPDNMSETHQYTYVGLVFRWFTVAFHCNAMLMPLKIMSNSARLICLSLQFDCSQQAFSTRDLLLSTMIPVAKKLASTHMVILCPSVHQSPRARSFCANWIMMFIGIWVRGGSRTLSSQPVVRISAPFHEGGCNTDSHILANVHSTSHTGKRCFV